MSILNILEFPDPRLRTLATPVESIDAALQALIDDMLETMYAAPGIGLAATQVDVHKQLIVIDVSESKDQPIVLINPKITRRDGEQVYQEGCLSVPGIYADVTRANSVRVEALDRTGAPLAIESDGLLAVCIQHELDHLAGKVFVDYLSSLKRDMVRKKLAKQAREKRGAGDREHSL
ncbi:MAG: peptide deformylase [Xanthomonadales bacterium]|nr:peptide deformylase [Xanthomonadales bacterium]